MRQLLILAGAAALALASGQAASADSLTLYCGADEEWCQLMATDFEKETGIKVDMTRKSSGETYAQVKAEAANPKGDIWWGGTGDPHLQAAEEGLTEEYKSPMLGELQRLGGAAGRAGDYRTVGVYSGALGFGYNTELLAKKKLPEPKCWADLLKPEYKDEIQMANPNSSGTAYTMLATIVQMMGEDEGFDYLKALHKNVNQYTKSGVGADQGGRPGRDADRHHLPARRGDAGRGRLPDQDRRAVRRHRLRDRLDVDHQGRAQPGRGQEVLRLGADARRAVARRRGEVVPGAVEQGRHPVRRRRPSSSRSS